MALINSLTTKPKLNISNIKSPFGSSATIPKISAGPLAKALGQGISKPKKSPLNINTFQIKTNIQNIDENIALRKRIDMLSGAVFNINQQLSEVNAVMQDIGGALALDFANRIANQQQDNKALKAQASADKRLSAESALEGSKKIGKSILSGLGNVAKAATGVSFSSMMDAGKLLALGIALNALWPRMEKIFQWTMNNLDKILIVGGAIATLNILGSLGMLWKLVKLMGRGKFALLLASLWIQDQLLTKPASKYSENLRKEAAAAGFTKDAIDPETGKPYENPANAYLQHLRKTDQIDKLMDLSSMKMHDGGLVTGPTQEVPAILERGEVVIPKELVGAAPKVNFMEMDLPIIRKQPSVGKKQVSLPKTTEVAYIPSTNPLNSYMITTPELHGICA